MTVWRCWSAAVLLTLTGCGDAPPVDRPGPASYALTLPVTPADGGTIQRLSLPAEALIAVQRDDLGDMRLYDAEGRRMALALADNAALAGRRVSEVAVYPVAGPLGAAGQQDLTVRIDNGMAVRVVTIDNGTVAAPEAPAVESAVLLDTRAVREPAQGLMLDATFPAGRPVTMTVQSSANLRDWQTLGETTLFRPEGSDRVLGDARLPLGGVELGGRYVMLRWPEGETVAVRAASVETAAATAPAVEVETSAPVLESPHRLRFDLPPTAPVDTIRVRQASGDGVLPVRLFGRANAEQPWALLSAATLRPGETGALLTGLSPAMRQFRLDADQRTGGWSSPPRLSLRFRPVTLIADFSGRPPFRLAVGQASAELAYLDTSALVPGPAPSIAGLPVARVDGGGRAIPRVTLIAPEGDGPFAPRKLALWAALLIGTAVLGFVAWRLAKGLPKPPVDPA